MNKRQRKKRAKRLIERVAYWWEFEENGVRRYIIGDTEGNVMEAGYAFVKKYLLDRSSNGSD